MGSFVPSPSQVEAIQSEVGPVLVLAGPGAGKTFCLIERIRHLIEGHGVEPGRICAVTYTNKAAEEVAGRLGSELGPRAEAVTRSTIHALAVRVLREHGRAIGIDRGFGIADDEYQREVLAKLGVKASWRGGVLARFTLHRVKNRALEGDDRRWFAHYRRYLGSRGLLDFDDLVIHTARLLAEHDDIGRAVAGRWDHLLVDEFQDLSEPQYRIIHRLGRGHGNVFAVGDDEQSIYGWNGADPRIIQRFANDFGVRREIVLEENRRSGRRIFEAARRLVERNPTLFRKSIQAVRETDHPLEVREFADERAEQDWLLGDVRRDREEHGLRWGDVAILYRKHEIGEPLEGRLVTEGIPCQLAKGRAIQDDGVVRYLTAALKVIGGPGDPIHGEIFARTVLPPLLYQRLEKESRRRRLGFLPTIRRVGRELPTVDEDGRKIRRALSAMNNLAAVARRHRDLPALVDDLLSQRVGTYRTLLEERADDLTDPAASPAVAGLAAELGRAREGGLRVLIPPMGGLEIGLAGMLSGAGLRLVDYLAPGAAPGPEDVVLGPGAGGDLGLALGTFKALQLVVARAGDGFRDFVAIDLETTDVDLARSEIVEVAAARVRAGRVVAEFHSLVRPRVEIAAGAAGTHGYSAGDLTGAPGFEEVWPRLREFLGEDVLIAHNGYQFDFPILARMVKELDGRFDYLTYDTLPLARWLRLGSARLEHLAERFGIDPGTPHQAVWDVRTLARVYHRLEDEKQGRVRRVALSGVLDHLAIALALSDPESLGDEARMLRDATRAYAFGRFSNCLEFYEAERERAGPGAASLDQLIDRLGGVGLMLRVRAERRGEQRYPAAMARIRRLMEGIEAATLEDQIQEFLGRVALSRSDGPDTDRERVNLLTMHATKGLEFSRVYVIGVEDAQLLTGGGREADAEEIEEARRLLYVGMTRAKDRLVLTRAATRGRKPTGGHRFLDEMELTPQTA
jgi:superfamily I DNA/RNA helicase